jgi:hypothetical protein
MWYQFRQKNSGGSCIIDNDVAHYVWREADACEEANDKA